MEWVSSKNTWFGGKLALNLLHFTDQVCFKSGAFALANCCITLSSPSTRITKTTWYTPPTKMTNPTSRNWVSKKRDLSAWSKKFNPNQLKPLKSWWLVQRIQNLKNSLHSKTIQILKRMLLQIAVFFVSVSQRTRRAKKLKSLLPDSTCLNLLGILWIILKTTSSASKATCRSKFLRRKTILRLTILKCCSLGQVWTKRLFSSKTRKSLNLGQLMN